MKRFGNVWTVDVELAFLQWIPDTTRLKERLCTFSEHLICKHKSLTSCNTAFRTLH